MKRPKRSKGQLPVVNKVNPNDNAPPSNPDIQDVPNSLKEFIKLKQIAQNQTLEAAKKTKRINSTKNPVSKSETEKEIPPKATKDRFHALKKRKNKKLDKLKLKRKMKKLEQQEKHNEDLKADLLDNRKEDIKFGETVHRPPQISVLPRKVTKTGFENRPGRKDDLLLKSLLKRPNLEDRKRTPLSDRRKNLSFSDQRQIEIERTKAMLAYKHMKMKNKKS